MDAATQIKSHKRNSYQDNLSVEVIEPAYRISIQQFIHYETIILNL